jgi:predicted nucleic acid-binding protein
VVVIVDASVAVKWFVHEPLHDEARALLLGSEPILAPDILAVEVANALWVKARRGDLDQATAQRAIAAITGSGVPELRPSSTLVARATQLAHLLDHPVYDCIYLALAASLDDRVVTADRRFHAAAVGAGRGDTELLEPVEG